MTPVWFQPLLFGNVGLTEMISFNHKAEFTFGFMSWPGFFMGSSQNLMDKNLGTPNQFSSVKVELEICFALCSYKFA